MRPLSGIRVIEFCSVAAGPFCAMLLADMGADVIKVENPEGGDTMRAWPPISGGFSENFASLNRNKRSVTLDLKDPTGNAQARDLIRSADVVLENNRPGVMQRLDLDYATVSVDQLKLVYCSISAFGQEGPRSREAGFDLTLQAMSGVMSVTGEPGAPPVKCGVPISDFGTGLYAAYAIAAALLQVRAGGNGAHIDASMFGASLAMGALQTSQYFGSGKAPERLGSAHPRNAPYQAFRAQDGYFAMAAGNNALYRAACNAIERPDLIDDPRFASTALRADHQTELLAILEQDFAAHSCADLLARFRKAGVPCSPINSYAEALADPQVAHMGWVQPVTLPSGVETRTFVSPLRFSGEGFPIYRDPPGLGEHNDEVFGAVAVEKNA
ncbi:CaiB/BaiF CoA transferase family protein [Methylobacterium goesingense]|uniref:Crotonobetainyl-CoA:carnitine CoA-transferase CaiB-like acyl-CoA transferase n=1 Tax=Methylobacterium goesingense TaxID=243690 RepID=A0ABV2L2C9_9HYPH|nr:CoA transferase [Methylobacterium goesingense]GJD75593.1 Acetyl-CoA:oxalate CoA-transferase [Methylobacterium goesingense]